MALALTLFGAASSGGSPAPRRVAERHDAGLFTAVYVPSWGASRAAHRARDGASPGGGLHRDRRRTTSAGTRRAPWGKHPMAPRSARRSPGGLRRLSSPAWWAGAVLLRVLLDAGALAGRASRPGRVVPRRSATSGESMIKRDIGIKDMGDAAARPRRAHGPAGLAAAHRPGAWLLLSAFVTTRRRLRAPGGPPGQGVLGMASPAGRAAQDRTEGGRSVGRQDDPWSTRAAASAGSAGHALAAQRRGGSLRCCPRPSRAPRGARPTHLPHLGGLRPHPDARRRGTSPAGLVLTWANRACGALLGCAEQGGSLGQPLRRLRHSPLAAPRDAALPEQEQPARRRRPRARARQLRAARRRPARCRS